MAWFSVVIITKNEEKNIERCLQSVEGLTDDIIIVDSFSTDRTKEICLKYKARFFEMTFLGFGPTKNWGNDQAKYDYILSLDADEALSDPLRESLIALTDKNKDVAYRFNRKTNFCGGWINHSGWYPDTKLRLWKKGAYKWNEELVHESLIASTSAKPIFLKGDLLHYSFYTIEQHIGQINKFSSLKARSDFQKGKKVNLLKLLFAPPVKFFKTYFLKLGFLDGWRGYVISRNSAFSTYLKYAKLKQLHQNQSSDET
ncbi:MAG: glycosyltransferase family 2 protein [Bacteroidota bacterium]